MFILRTHISVCYVTIPLVWTEHFHNGWYVNQKNVWLFHIVHKFQHRYWFQTPQLINIYEHSSPKLLRACIMFTKLVVYVIIYVSFTLYYSMRMINLLLSIYTVIWSITSNNEIQHMKIFLCTCILIKKIDHQLWNFSEEVITTWKF